MKECYYYVVSYKNDKRIPIPFKSYQEADDFIHKRNIHGYITIKPKSDIIKSSREERK